MKTTNKFAIPVWRGIRVPVVGEVIELSEFLECDRKRVRVVSVKPDPHFPDETKIVGYSGNI